MSCLIYKNILLYDFSWQSQCCFFLTYFEPTFFIHLIYSGFQIYNPREEIQNLSVVCDFTIIIRSLLD